MNGGSILNGYDGVILYEDGRFTLNGGLIDGCGEGVYLYDSDSSFIMNGGTVSNSRYYDIYYPRGTFTLSGGAAGSVYVIDGNAITIGGELPQTASFGVITDQMGVFTSGYSTYNTADPGDYFRASGDTLGVVLSGGEAAIAEGYVNNVSYVRRSWNGSAVVSETKTRAAVPVPSDGGVISAGGSYGIGSGENGSDVTITLGYTDATRESISVTATTYGGAVTLEQPFASYTGIYQQYQGNTFLPGTFPTTAC
ncbi:MAG: hypothetical protein IKP40_05560 [Clostridia bacterium]|nr:hypothetical protein [Clostridia bacterium]